MSEAQQESVKAKFIQLQNLLSAGTLVPQLNQYLIQLTQFLIAADHSSPSPPHQEAYHELRDTVKHTLTFLAQVIPCPLPIEGLIKDLLIAICRFCSQYYSAHLPHGCGSMIREFLTSDCRLFIYEFAAAAPSEEEEQKMKKGEQKEWKWARPSSYKSIFFCRCVEQIMNHMERMHTKFDTMPLGVMAEYLKLLYYMDDYLQADKMTPLAMQYVTILETLFHTPSKATVSQATKEVLQEIVDHLNKLLRLHKDSKVHQRINLLGVGLGMTMLKMTSIEKRLTGCKIISKFSYEQLYRTSADQNEIHYCKWLLSQGFFQLVFEENSQTTLIKAGEETFKLLVKKGMVDKDMYIKFFNILEKGDADLRKAMFRLIDPFRIDYHQIQAIIQIFGPLRAEEFYDQQFFYFAEGLSRYSTETQLKLLLKNIEQIIAEYYSKLESYLTKRRAVECYAYIFEKILVYKDVEQRVEAYKEVVGSFIEKPSENKLILLRTLFNSLSESKIDSVYQGKMAIDIVEKLPFMSTMLHLAVNDTFKGDLFYFVKNILNKYKKTYEYKPFSRDLLLEAVQYSELFQIMIEFSPIPELESLMEELASLTTVKNYNFECFKHVFTRVNSSKLRPIKKEYADVIITEVTIENPAEFKGIDTLKYLILNSEQEEVRRGASQLLVEVYTNLADDFREEGELYLVEWMKSMVLLVRHNLREFCEEEDGSVRAVTGTLQLMQELLLNTQFFGVGSLPAHNSQIPTSTTYLKIYNNCTYGDDVLKVFEKKFSSNTTLFEVIIQISKQFKIGPLDIALEYPDRDYIRHNGLTLEELQLNMVELNAIKLPQSRCKQEALLVDGELSPKAIEAFTHMFNRFAKDGYMTNVECAAYIEGVTFGFCPLYDVRITQFFTKYDSDKDDKLVLEDFLNFYKDCVQDPQRLETVDKNLANLRYRRDLQPFDAELATISEELLFRHHVWQHQQIYEYLFRLSHSKDSLISGMSQNLLLRLPTFPKIVNSLTDTVDLTGKNSFQVQYLLAALQIHLTKDKQTPQVFIEKGNHLSILDHLSLLSKSDNRTPTDQKCLVICLHTLRSLLGQFDLRDSEQTQYPILNYKIPPTKVFLQIIEEGIAKNNSALLEPSFALQLTQQDLPLATISEAAFNKDKDTRLLTCNFLYYALLAKQSQATDLFSMPVRPTHNLQWFTLLTRIIRLDLEIDIQSIFKVNLQALSGASQSLEGTRHDQLVHGSLKLIQQLYPKLSQSAKTLLNDTLNFLLPRLLSDQNRDLVYNLRLIESPDDLLKDLSKGVDVVMSRQGQPRNKFVGIRNLGCICYMNSILQQLFMLPKFRNLTLGLKPVNEESEVEGIKIVDDFLAQLQRMYVHLQWSQKQYYDPITFCRAIKDPQGKPINTNIQEDAHEFINTCFDKMEQYCKQQDCLDSLSKLFSGKTVTEIICQTCENKNEVLEQFYHLSLEVKGLKSLKESFDKFIQPEYISDYHCAHCDKKVEKITKQTLLKECPEVLIINLQRIIFDLETFLKVKVHTKLQFGQTLDLFNYVSSSEKPEVYHLKGVVIHSGTSEGGHYYSLIKEQGRWFKFNDQSVTPFNEGDIGREAFGGEDFTDSWGQLSSSTNAYILFYQKQSLEKEKAEEISMESVLKDKVMQDNEAFMKQLQFNQPSFFTALERLTCFALKVQESSFLQKLLEVHLRVMNHLVINSDVKILLISTTRDNLLNLLDTLPHLCSDILQRIIDKDSQVNYQQVLCSHNDSNVRDFYSKTITKLATILISQEENIVLPPLVKLLVDDLICLLGAELFLKNMHKSYQFFELWRSLAWLPAVKNALMDRECLVIFLDLVMGRDSPLCQDKKRSELHSSQALPIVPIVTSIIEFKKNQLGFAPLEPPLGQLYELTPDEAKFLSDGLFYRKMMKNKLDNGLLAPIIRLVCFKDGRMSRVLAEVLLKAMNSNDEIEDKSVVFVNMKAYLKIEDQFREERMKWLLGIAQLDSIRYGQQQFGMMTSSESKVISYVSSCLFLKEEKYMPFLSTLFDKRKYFNSFSANGVLMLLQLLLESEVALRYVYSLPPPTYLHLSYLDWIQRYGIRVKLEEHYSLPMDRKALASKIEEQLDSIKKKAAKLELLGDLPINPLIIGKNAHLVLKESLKEKDYQIDLWVHHTYILPNKPYGMGNFSLPDEEFSFSSTKDPVTAQFFLKCNEPSFEQPEGLAKKDSMITFEVKTEVGLLVKFEVQNFRHVLYLRTGNHSINCPFVEGRIGQLMQIEEHLDDVAVVKEPQPEPVMGAGVGAGVESAFMGADVAGYLMEMNCGTCTYLNVGRQRCQMCGSALF